MKKTFAVAALAATAILGTASMASANVAVENGLGHVDKGDIQSSSALNLTNNNTFQTLAKGDKIKFTATVDRVIGDYEMTCGPSATGVTMHRVITQPAVMEVEATKVWNGNHSQILGYDLTGKTGKAISVGTATMTETSCPAGSFPWMPVGAPKQYVTGISGLQVTDGTNTVDLPNTPVEVVAPTV